MNASVAVTAAQQTDYEQYFETISALVVPAYTYLFEAGSSEGHWSETRSTALAGMCVDLVESTDGPWCTAVKQWLRQSQIKEGATVGSWGEEIWDTSMAVLALKSLRATTADPAIQLAVRWISGLFSLNGRNNWHDEPWETSWALIALLTGGLIPKEMHLEVAIHWLLTLQDTEGAIVAPHYTAYFVLINSLLSKVDIDAADRQRISDGSRRAADFLVRMLQTSDSERLWTGEAWSNGQILWCLTRARVFPVSDEGLLAKIISWFRANQSPSGNWADVEDTSSAILGLLELLVTKTATFQGVKARALVQEHLRKAVEPPSVQLDLKFLEHRKKIDCWSINFTRRRRQLFAILLSIAGGLTAALKSVSFITGHWPQVESWIKLHLTK